MEFELATGDSGASATIPEQCSTLRVGGHIMVQGHPCKIANLLTSKPGKHGSTKAHIVAFDIFTGKRYEEVCPTSKMMMVPVLRKTENHVSNIDHDGRVTILDTRGQIGDSLLIAPIVQDKYPNPQKVMEQAFEMDMDLLAQVLAFDGEAMVMELRTKAPAN